MTSIILNLRTSFRYGLVFLFITLAAVIYGISPGISFAGLQISPCYPGCFCEGFQRGAIVQPISTFSNLWYVLVGVGILAAARISLPGDTQPTNLIIRNPAYSIAYGVIVIFIGLTSFFYHVSLTLVGRWVDYIGMYAFASFAVVYNLTRLELVRGRFFWIIYAGLNLGLAIPMIAISSLVVKRALLVGVILLLLGLEGSIYLIQRTRHIQVGYFLVALGLLALATGFNLLDERGTLCNPPSLWQWHAVWHFLTAAVPGILYLYFRSEDDRQSYPSSI